MHDFLARSLGHLAEHIAGRIGERAAEAENLLAGCAGIEGDGVGGDSVAGFQASGSPCA